MPHQLVDGDAELIGIEADLATQQHQLVFWLMLQGLDIRGEQQTLQDPEFLMQQLSWREELEALRDAADPEAQIPVFEQRISSEHNRLMLQLQQALAAAELPIAADRIRKLKFVRKLRDELSRLEDSLMDL